MEIFNGFLGEQALMPMVILISCILLVFMQRGSDAHEFRVGGRYGWAVPDNTSTERYSHWARQNRFQAGDSLVFVYNSSEDSVLQVNQGDYLSCATSQPRASFKDGNTVFELPRSGSFFFISGGRGHCQKSQKLHVIVLTIRGPPPPSPARSPHSIASPLPAPRGSTVKGTPAPSPNMSNASSPPTSTSAPAGPPLQSVGAMCGLLISLCVFIL